MAPNPLAIESDSAGPLGAWIERVLEIGGGVVPALRKLRDEIPVARLGNWDELCQTLADGDATRAARALVADPDTWIPLVSAAAPGATTGDGLAEGEFLRRAVDAVVRRETSSRWWLPALYPLAVFLLAMAVACTLATVVVPPFEALLADFGIRLPVITAAVLGLSRWLRAGWWALLPGLALLMLLAATWRRRPAWLRWPGDWFVRSGRFARFAADLLAAGVPRETAISVAARAADPAARPGDGGLPAWLSETVRHALADDMPAATRIRLLARIAACHEQRLSSRHAWAAWFLGPFAVFITGLAVFLIVLALFMPLFSLVSALS